MAIVTSALFALALAPQPISLVTPAKALVTEVLIVVVKSLVHSANCWVTTMSSTAISFQPPNPGKSNTKYKEVFAPTSVSDRLKVRCFQSVVLTELGSKILCSFIGVWLAI